MEESYIEWLVKRKDPIYALPVKIIMVLVCAFSVLLARKKAFDCEKDDVQLIAPVDSYMLKDYAKQGMKVMDCTSGKQGAEVYALMYQKGADTMKVLIEPNEKMLAAMRHTFPRKFVK